MNGGAVFSIVIVRDQKISFVSWLGWHFGFWFVAELFGVGLGLLLCLVDASANLSYVIARWLYIDNKAFPIR